MMGKVDCSTGGMVAFSGGKDSTAMVLFLAEQGVECDMLFTPTGNDPPDLLPHIRCVAKLVGWKLHIRTNGTLFSWIDHWNHLPNHRQRWCTRLLKIEPCTVFRGERPNKKLYVGLRADEAERPGGLYPGVGPTVRPLEDAGIGLDGVMGILAKHGVTVPKRTDCLLCWAQRLREWYWLWRDHPTEFARGVLLEQRIGHTFRSPTRDSWPAKMSGLREQFENGRMPRGGEDDECAVQCRVCSM